MLFLKWRTFGCFLLVWVNCPPIFKGNLEKTIIQLQTRGSIILSLKTTSRIYVWLREFNQLLKFLYILLEKSIFGLLKQLKVTSFYWKPTII